MLEIFLENSSVAVIGLIGMLATVVSIIVEVLKNVLPKSFPTKLLAMITSILITLIYVFIFYDVNVKIITIGVIGSFVVSFVSMFGFDSLKSIFDRFMINNKGDK